MRDFDQGSCPVGCVLKLPFSFFSIFSALLVVPHQHICFLAFLGYRLYCIYYHLLFVLEIGLTICRQRCFEDLSIYIVLFCPFVVRYLSPVLGCLSSPHPPSLCFSNSFYVFFFFCSSCVRLKNMKILSFFIWLRSACLPFCRIGTFLSLFKHLMRE